MEYDSSDEDLISHITKQRHTESSSELDKYLKIDRAPVLGNTLDWWKVNFICKLKY
jgi:hypothetical protein